MLAEHAEFATVEKQEDLEVLVMLRDPQYLEGSEKEKQPSLDTYLGKHREREESLRNFAEQWEGVWFAD